MVFPMTMHLMELLYLASMAPAGAEKKVRNNIELYAPWMPTDEVEALIQHLSLTPHYQKVRTAERTWTPSAPNQCRTRTAQAMAHQTNRRDCAAACPTNKRKGAHSPSSTETQEGD